MVPLNTRERKWKWKWKYEIGDVIDNIEIVNRKAEQKQEKSKHTKSGISFVTNKYYQYKCLKCGFDGSKICYKNGNCLLEHWVHEEALVQGVRCACCHGTVVQIGVNDVATTDPDVVQYFVDKKLATKYSRSSTEKIDIQCPICGFVNPTKTTIYNLVWEGCSCFKCGSSISYPEKFMYFFLKQLNIYFETHKVFSWSKNIKNSYNDKTGDKEYDFYLPDFNLIIETHGRQHYEDGTPFSVYGKAGRTLEEEWENDKLKQILAKENGCNYLIINCKKSNFKYISNSILSSDLNKYVSLQNVDWGKCNRLALNGLKMLVINEKKNNTDISSTELAKRYDVSVQTIINWLKQGSDICGYNPQEEVKKSGFYAKHYAPVYSPELDMGFQMIKEAAQFVQIPAPGISACLKNESKHAGRHPITGELLTWERWTLEQYEEWHNKRLTIQD